MQSAGCSHVSRCCLATANISDYFCGAEKLSGVKKDGGHHGLQCFSQIIARNADEIVKEFARWNPKPHTPVMHPFCDDQDD